MSMSVPLLSFRMRSGYLLFLFLLVEMLTLLSNVYGDQTSASAATKLLLFGVIDCFLLLFAATAVSELNTTSVMPFSFRGNAFD